MNTTTSSERAEGQAPPFAPLVNKRSSLEQLWAQAYRDNQVERVFVPGEPNLPRPVHS